MKLSDLTIKSINERQAKAYIDRANEMEIVNGLLDRIRQSFFDRSKSRDNPNINGYTIKKIKRITSNG